MHKNLCPMSNEVNMQMEEKTSYIPIEELKTVGISASDVSKLAEAGYNTVQSLVLLLGKSYWK